LTSSCHCSLHKPNKKTNAFLQGRSIIRKPKTQKHLVGHDDTSSYIQKIKEKSISFFKAQKITNNNSTHISQTREMTNFQVAMHPSPFSDLPEGEEYPIISLDLSAQSVVSVLSCSVSSRCLKRSCKATDFSDLQHCSEQSSSKKRRRRGASYTIVEIHSLLHLMKRVLPRCSDEWEIVRMVHHRIFPNNDRTVPSLKKKFRDLCMSTDYQRNHAHPQESYPATNSNTKASFSEREIMKAREVHTAIAQKPPGFELVLSNKEENVDWKAKNYPISLPSFKVKVPNPLEGNQTTSDAIPSCVQIPLSPDCFFGAQPEIDEMSDLELDGDIEDDDDDDNFYCQIKVESPIISSDCDQTPAPSTPVRVVGSSLERGALVSPLPFVSSSDRDLHIVEH